MATTDAENRGRKSAMVELEIRGIGGESLYSLLPTPTTSRFSICNFPHMEHIAN